MQKKKKRSQRSKSKGERGKKKAFMSVMSKDSVLYFLGVLDFDSGYNAYIYLIHHILQCIDSQNHNLLPHLEKPIHKLICRIIYIQGFDLSAKNIW